MQSWLVHKVFDVVNKRVGGKRSSDESSRVVDVEWKSTSKAKARLCVLQDASCTRAVAFVTALPQGDHGASVTFAGLTSFWSSVELPIPQLTLTKWPLHSLAPWFDLDSTTGERFSKRVVLRSFRPREGQQRPCSLASWKSAQAELSWRSCSGNPSCGGTTLRSLSHHLFVKKPTSSSVTMRAWVEQEEQAPGNASSPAVATVWLRSYPIERV